MFVHTEPSVVYISPTGTGDGYTEETAAELITAITSENVIAGDTLILLDGIYNMSCHITVQGNADEYIVVKPKNYGNVIFEDTLSVGVGDVDGYLVVRNIIFRNLNEDRGEWTDPKGTHVRADAVTVYGNKIKIINNIIHDTGIGIGDWGDDNVLYGNLIFNCGVADYDGGYHGIYEQGERKLMKHNVVGPIFNQTIQAYGTAHGIEYCDFLENIFLNRKRVLIGSAGVITDNIKVNENHIVGPLTSLQIGYNFKYNGVCEIKRNRTYTAGIFSMQYWNNLEMSDNVFVQGEGSASDGFRFVDDRAPSIYTWNLHDNKYYYLGSNPAGAFKVEYGEDYFGGDGWGSWAEWNAAGYDTVGSTYSEVKPAANELFVYPNEYPDTDDMRMGIVVIWNWAGDNTVAVDLTALGLQVGTTYRCRQAQDPLVDVDTWVCAGNSYTFAMTGHTVAKPIGFDEELVPTQFPTFGCFIIEKVV